MLILTPSGLETPAERAFFAELASWDTGGSVRGALVASLALSDGPMDRRICDAVVLVPEGVAVVRVVEVVRQSGVVTVLPEGSWTIGPGAGPGDVLRLAGGGSTPLDGLMRAGMEAATRLRRAGLEPGRIARLSVLHGELSGLVPADGDLGEGDQVALLESRSLLLGIARAARYAGTGNPRLWTTADVRAALEALGVGGRSPAVEELNGEGFPYSPYVLRRRELLAPAGFADQPTSHPAGPTATPPATRTDWPATGPGSSGAPVGSPGGPLVDPAAAAALAAAAAAQQTPEPRTGGDTVSLPGGSAAPSGPSAPAPQAPAEPSWHETQAIVPRPAPEAQQAPRTAWSPQPVQQPAPVDETGGIGGIFAEPTRTGEAADPPTRGRPPAPAGGPDRPGRSRRGLLVVLAGVLLVVLLGLGGLWLTRGGSDEDASGPAPTSTAAPTSTGPSTPAALPVGTVQSLGETDYTLQVVEYDTTCRDHAYGAISGFFGTTDCLGLSRALWSAEVDGVPAVVSVSRVTMPDAARATALLSLTDVSGTGNVSDLLREGARYPGGPEELRSADYASTTVDDVAVIVETSWTGQAGPAAGLQQLADDALDLVATQD
ncbi:hypothetical protein [Klenkia taihuensis]|uniref:Nuclease-related domain-containing protein n=1 Tax=Klenkia taihuensis TaxID=1225127 RepID=A0A1I1SF61_9ACTN|nr:hypothetical protein [Klenkia taihuensis]GHE13681.1 hypothetical protein GCM10011381_37010 [Klenkia taihuensis]SFD41650.1 hypothetical protein SAMN05661030_3263 [Klenkia taihuensis]